MLLALFGVVWVASGVKAEIPTDWMLENVLVFGLAVVLVGSYRRFMLSNTSYVLIFVFLCLHECGAHYQYSAAVPGEWMRSATGAARNDYDRLVHFSFGLLFWYPQREVLGRRAGVRSGWLEVLPVLTTLACSAVYEVIEAVTAVVVDPADAIAFLGAQGDPWDAQKDMSLAVAGAVVRLVYVPVSGGSGAEAPRRGAVLVLGKK